VLSINDRGGAYGAVWLGKEELVRSRQRAQDAIIGYLTPEQAEQSMTG
jgi:hypothetical protein